MENLNTILVVDDDRDIRSLLAEYLESHSFNAVIAADGKTMWKALSEHRVDLLVLDLNMPGDDGLTLCRNLRAHAQWSKLPVLMLTARGEAVDRIIGLEMGADDYLTKPFEPRELLARIKSILRRTQSSEISQKSILNYRFDQWTLDITARHLLNPQGMVIALSGAEFRLLLIFLQQANNILTRDQLIQLLYGRESDPFDRSIDIQMSRLRLKLGDDARAPRIIKTVRNGGYILAVNVDVETQI